jgi:hypothetical protein
VELLLPIQLLVSIDLFRKIHLNILLHVSHSLHLSSLDDHALVLFLVHLLLKHAHLGVED